MKLNNMDRMNDGYWEVQQVYFVNERSWRTWAKKLIENRILEHLVGNLRNPNDACNCIIALPCFNANIEKSDQVISPILSKLSKKDIERLRSGGVNGRLMQEVLFTWSKNSSAFFMRQAKSYI